MSNTIYSAILPVISQDKNKYNYVYQITEISTGMKYIGSRGTKQSNPLKLRSLFRHPGAIFAAALCMNRLCQEDSRVSK